MEAQLDARLKNGPSPSPSGRARAKSVPVPGEKLDSHRGLIVVGGMDDHLNALPYVEELAAQVRRGEVGSNNRCLSLEFLTVRSWLSKPAS